MSKIDQLYSTIDDVRDLTPEELEEEKIADKLPSLKRKMKEIDLLCGIQKDEYGAPLDKTDFYKFDTGESLEGGDVEGVSLEIAADTSSGNIVGKIVGPRGSGDEFIVYKLKSLADGSDLRQGFDDTSPADVDVHSPGQQEYRLEEFQDMLDFIVTQERDKAARMIQENEEIVANAREYVSSHRDEYKRQVVLEKAKDDIESDAQKIERAKQEVEALKEKASAIEERIGAAQVRYDEKVDGLKELGVLSVDELKVVVSDHEESKDAYDTQVRDGKYAENTLKEVERALGLARKIHKA